MSHDSERKVVRWMVCFAMEKSHDSVAWPLSPLLMLDGRQVVF